MTILAILFLATAAQAAQPAPSGDASFIAALGEARLTVPEIPPASGAVKEGGSQEQCAQVLKDLDSISDMDVLNTCADFYWHNGEFENPALQNLLLIYSCSISS